MKTLITAALAALSIALAPMAGADADDLTNVEVAGNPDATSEFTPYQVTIPEPASGGQGAFDFVQDFDGDGDVEFRFDDGLSDSSRAMLDAINAAP